MIRLDTISPGRAAVPAAPFVATGGPVARSPAQPRHAAGQRLAGSPTIAAIKRAVAAEFQVPTRIMEAPPPRSETGENPRRLSRVRQVAMHLACELTRHSRARVGYFFGGRDPTTVLYACRAVERRLAEDADLRAKVERVRRELGL